ncbi:MAG: sugar phosphate isomerase/epimerase [Deltaproteobacteria bacterium]|nr:sugar phosphate isomerase/epimerase [Deltaproteobacteria bacterium]
MIGLSTVWTSRDAQSGQELLGPILDLGFEGVELEYRITQQLYEEIRPRLRAHELRVLSIHNYFPVPDILPLERASGDCFSLSSLDREEREKGVSYTSRTLEVAHDLEAQAVVLHLGMVETGLPKDGLQELYREGRWEGEGEPLLQREMEERGRQREPHLDAVFFSLERILKRAERLGVTLGIENRYYLQEIPDKEEIGIILEQFCGGPIGYWHDTGHAATLETLGILGHEELLQLYAPRLVGVHLHDALGVDDHRPPGEGEIDFGMVKGYLPDGAIKIMEIHPQATGEEVLKGLAFLKEKRIGP